MKGTRLFQRAGSPLIQGRSRMERPFWTEWVTGALVALLAWIGAGLAWGFIEAQSFAGTVDPAIEVMEASLVGALVGSAGGSAVGVGVGRAWGLFKPWVAGAVLGAVFALGAAAYLAWPILTGS